MKTLAQIIMQPEGRKLEFKEMLPAKADLISIEEKITNIIHDQCYPVILPEVTFLNFDGRHLIKLQIFKGSNPPYYLKHKGAGEGTCFRVGYSNRQASPEIILGTTGGNTL